MPLTELESKEALRVAADWLALSEAPGCVGAREGIAGVIPLISMGIIAPRDLDELASLVEENGLSAREPGVPAETFRSQVHEAVKAAFDHVRSTSTSG
jgi:hypothetical protein